MICDPTCLPVAVTAADARWSGARVGGDQAFRDEASAAALERGVHLDFDRRADVGTAIPIMPAVSSHVGTRRAMAIARHLGAREISLDGKRMYADLADRTKPREDRATMLELSQADAVVITAPPSRVSQMDQAGCVPAVTVGETAIFSLDRTVTSTERTALTGALLESYGGELQRRFNLEGEIKYGPAGMCEGFRRFVEGMRPHPLPISFAERIKSIKTFFDGFVPEENAPIVVALPEPPQPKQTQTRKRGSRSR